MCIRDRYYAKKMMKITYLVNGLCCIAVILTMPLSLSLYGLSREALELGLSLIHIFMEYRPGSRNRDTEADQNRRNGEMPADQDSRNRHGQ